MDFNVTVNHTESLHDERERERERETQRERQRERDTHRERETETEKERERTEKWREFFDSIVPSTVQSHLT